MINKHELRIGNLVNHRTKGNLVVDLDLLRKISRYPQSFNPIPVNTETLDYFSFEQLDDNHLSIKGLRIWMCNGMFLCDKTGVQLKTIHWLQNYYFFKTGSELKLKTK